MKLLNSHSFEYSSLHGNKSIICWNNILLNIDQDFNICMVQLAVYTDTVSLSSFTLHGRTSLGSRISPKYVPFGCPRLEPFRSFLLHSSTSCPTGWTSCCGEGKGSFSQVYRDRLLRRPLPPHKLIGQSYGSLGLCFVARRARREAAVPGSRRDPAR